MISGATYRASGNHERTWVSGVSIGAAEGLASFKRLDALGAASIADSVLSLSVAAETSTVSVTEPGEGDTSSKLPWNDPETCLRFKWLDLQALGWMPQRPACATGAPTFSPRSSELGVAAS